MGWCRCRRDLPPPGICPTPLGEIPSDLALPGGRSLGISPPFRDLAPPPFLRFRSSYFLYIIGVKSNGEKIGHFDTCTNYSIYVVNETHL